MLINSTILSVPPYISVSWSNVQCIHMRQQTLSITLTSGSTVSIEGLSAETIDLIFKAHTAYLSAETTKSPTSGRPKPPYSPFAAPEAMPAAPSESPFHLGIASMDGLGTAMQHLQHNSQLADTPDLPAEMLEKISAIARIVAPEDLSSLPEAEPHCNCPHCQIARAIRGKVNPPIPPTETEDEIVDPKELTFQQWRIQQMSEHLFQVINQLDPNEVYHVHLGDPIGCTCGETGCEHIPAVLKS